MRILRPALVPLAALALVLATAPAGAGPRSPDFSIGMGGTTAVSSDLDSGGYSVWGSALWAVDGPWSFGVVGFADDMGHRLVQVSGGGPPPVPLGTLEQRHRFVFGGGWEMRAGLPEFGPWRPSVNALWTVTRVQDDAHGEVLGAVSTTGLGLGLALRRPVLQRSTVGVGLRYHHLFDDTVDGYLSGTLEWGWRFGKTP